MRELTIFAMTDKGLAVVRQAIATGRDAIALVVGARDPAVTDDCYERIKTLCESHGIPHIDRVSAPPVATPWAIAASWRWMLDATSTRLVVFHDSLLPRLRGFNPLVTALINGDRRIGVTALLATTEVDCGDIVAQRAVEIGYPVTVQQAITKLLPLYEDLSRQVVESITAGGELCATPQNSAGATYSLWRDEADYAIDWSRSACDLRRFVDAVGPPYRGASSRLVGRKVRVLAAEEVDDVTIENRTPGKVLKLQRGCPVVVCGAGLLLLTEVIDEVADASLLPMNRLRVRFEGREASAHQSTNSYGP